MSGAATTNPPGRPKAEPWRLWLKLSVSLALLAFLFRQTDLHAVWTLFRSLRLPLLLSSVALYLLAQIVSTLRWRCLLQAEHINLSTWRLILLYFEGMFFNLMLPTVIGGDIVRGYQVFRLTQQKESSLASILVERLSGYVALIMIASTALILGYSYLHDPVTVWLTAASAAGIVAIIAGLLNDQLQIWFLGLLNRAGLGRFHETLQRFYGALRRYWKHRRALLQALGLSLILQSLVIIIFYLISRSLNLSVPLKYFFLFVPLISVVSMLPISVAGLGIREGSSVYFFAKAGLDSAGAISLSLLWFAVTACCSGLGAIVFIVGHPQQEDRP